MILLKCASNIYTITDVNGVTNMVRYGIRGGNSTVMSIQYLDQGPSQHIKPDNYKVS